MGINSLCKWLVISLLYVLALPGAPFATEPKTAFRESYRLAQDGDTANFDKWTSDNECNINSAVAVILPLYIDARVKYNTILIERSHKYFEMLMRNQYYAATQSRSIVDAIRTDWSQHQLSLFNQAYFVLDTLSRQRSCPDIVLWAESIFVSLNSYHYGSEAAIRLGEHFYEQKQYDSAIECYSRAVEKSQIPGDSELQARALTGLFINQIRRTQRRVEAHRNGARALALALECDYLHILPFIYTAIASDYIRTGDFERAESAYSKASKIKRQTGGVESVYELTNRAVCYYEMSDEALRNYADEATADSLEWLADSLFGLAEQRAGQKSKPNSEIAWIKYHVAYHKLNRGDTSAVHDLLETADSILSLDPDSQATASVRYVQGILERRRSNMVRSIARLYTALRLYTKPSDSIYAAKELGWTFLESDQADSAIEIFGKCEQIMQRTKNSMPVSLLRRTYLRDKNDLVSGLTLAWLRLGLLDSALNIAERFRARSVIDALHEQRSGSLFRCIENRNCSEYMSEINDLFSKFRACSYSEDSLSMLPSLIRAFGDSIYSMRIEAANSGPLSPNETFADASYFGRNSQSKAPEVYYFVQDSSILAWYSVEGRIGVDTVALNNAQFITSLRSAIEFIKTKPSERIDTSKDGILDSLSSLIPRNVVTSMLQYQAITIYPHGLLSYLPFEAIKIGGRYIGADVAISYYPSLSIRTVLDKLPASVGGAKHIAVLGGDFADENLGHCYSDMQSPLAAYSSLIPLSFLEQGIAELRQRYDDSTFSFVNVSDQELMLMESSTIQRCRFLHFISHAVVLDNYPELSSLLLPWSADSESDGLLRNDEIAEFDLRGKLVFLAACRTGLGKYVTGEGFQGLQRSFLVAGAKSLVVSLWPVFELSTHLFSAEFYNSVALGHSTAEALLAARKHLLEDNYFNDPFYWAPFIGIGDWQ